jgi:hypothetical protein
MAAIYSNGGNRWNRLGFNFTKRDALSSVYKISMTGTFYKISLAVNHLTQVNISKKVYFIMCQLFSYNLFQFLLWSQVIAMATFLLTAVCCSWMETSIASID